MKNKEKKLSNAEITRRIKAACDEWNAGSGMANIQLRHPSYKKQMEMEKAGMLNGKNRGC